MAGNRRIAQVDTLVAACFERFQPNFPMLLQQIAR
jgi:hypothetical protein